LPEEEVKLKQEAFKERKAAVDAKRTDNKKMTEEIQAKIDELNAAKEQHLKEFQTNEKNNEVY
jgi:hypothetical protein